jgi:hypothetical protein
MADVREFAGFELSRDSGTKVWRYMALDRFQALLQSRALYFASARQFTDHYEGAISRLDNQRRIALSAYAGADGHISNAFEQLRRLTKISCWHMSAHESEAMWRLYVAEGKGVAIQSTIARLAASFSSFRLDPSYGEETIWLGAVRYLDYRTTELPDRSMLGRFFCKRRSFSHEAEMRAVVSLRQAEEFAVQVPENGILVGVDLERLIERVFVAPGVSDEFVTDVKRALKKTALSTPVERTELDDPVYY